jgi:hypothetical protein
VAPMPLGMNAVHQQRQRGGVSATYARPPMAYRSVQNNAQGCTGLFPIPISTSRSSRPAVIRQSRSTVRFTCTETSSNLVLEGDEIVVQLYNVIQVRSFRTQWTNKAGCIPRQRDWQLCEYQVEYEQHRDDEMPRCVPLQY